MKKNILIILLIPNMVLASTVYTDFKEYIMGTDELLESSDTLKRDEYYLYNTYYEKVDSFYAPKENIQEGYIVNEKDFYIEEKNSLENNSYSVRYQTKCYNNNLKTKSVILTDFSNELKLSEIKMSSPKGHPHAGVGIKNQEGTKDYAYDWNLYGETVTLTKDSIIEFYFYQYWNLEDLEINLYFTEQNLNNTEFNLILDNIEYPIKINVPYEGNNHIKITFDNYYNTFLNENDFYIEGDCISYHTLQIPNYLHTKTSIVPLNNYLPLNNADKFLMDDFIKKYNYHKREKIEIEDNIYLENNKFNINNFIKFSTIPLTELKLIDEINYNKSGIYPLKIYYEDKLLIEKNINYKTYKVNKKEMQEESKLEEKKTQILKTTKKSFKQTNKRLKTTKKNLQEQKTNKIKSNTVNHIVKLNNKNIVKENNNKTTVIIIISLLIIALTIFEIILLYVKHKYF